MKIGFIGVLAAVAGLVVLAAGAGVLVVIYTSSGSGTRTHSESSNPPNETAPPVAAPAVSPEAPVVPAQMYSTDPKTGKVIYVRSCGGAYAEAINIGVLPNFAELKSAEPNPGKARESVCSAETPSSHYQIAYFTTCAGGGDTCPVLARVTQEGKYVIFHRD